MQVSVIIVNYKVKYYLAQCLHSVTQALREVEGDIYVVDNDSQDDSIDFCRQLFPDVHYILNPHNTGFAHANNLAIRQSRGRYVMLLNPDTIINEHLIADCIQLLDSAPTIGATGVRMLNSDGTFAPESRRGTPTPFVAACKMLGLTRLFPTSHLFGRYYMKYLDEFTATPIDIISGACMFIRRTTIEQCGLLDEDFFMYGEDIDLSYRMLLTRQHNYYLPTRLLHYKGESTHKNSYHYVYVFYNAMDIFFRKHYSSYSWLITIPIRTAIYLKGAQEYLSRKTRQLFAKPYSPLANLQSGRVLVKASNHTVEDIIDILDRNAITYDLTENPTIRYSHVVYDTTSHTYEAILSDLERRAKHPDTRTHIATYSPQHHAIITQEIVLT